jgi:carboxypeptidase Taq
MAEVRAINDSAAVLGWDQQTYMPQGGAEARSEQLAALGKISHRMSTGADMMKMLKESEREAAGFDPDSDDAAFVRVTRRDFDRAVKVPSELVGEIARVTTLAYEEWTQARRENDYARFAPWLEKNLDLTRKVAECLGYDDGEMYDALLDQYEPGMKAAQVRTLFEAVKPTLIALVQEIAARGPEAVDDSVLHREYDLDTQRRFGEKVVTDLGFDWKRGRQDQAVHPFCTSFTRGDVRITTRYDDHFLPCALFGSMHETGHALYEQGVAPRYDGNVLGGGTSLGVHESQSRLWENLVGRSRAFWERYYGGLQAAFPGALQNTAMEEWYRAINKVSPSLIRVEADEVTYNLHILLRFELEVELLEGRLSAADAPQAWNAKMQEYLGLTPPTDSAGILQDVHWSGGSIGYFPTYSIGNILSVQFFEKADAALGGRVAALVASGEFGPLLEWLQENIYQWGRKYEPAALVQRVTGGPLDPAPYLRYLNNKFGAIYGL